MTLLLLQRVPFEGHVEILRNLCFYWFIVVRIQSSSVYKMLWVYFLHFEGEEKFVIRFPLYFIVLSSYFLQKLCHLLLLLIHIKNSISPKMLLTTFLHSLPFTWRNAFYRESVLYGDSPTPCSLNNGLTSFPEIYFSPCKNIIKSCFELYLITLCYFYRLHRRQLVHKDKQFFSLFQKKRRSSLYNFLHISSYTLMYLKLWSEIIITDEEWYECLLWE